ncbi:MAG: rod-binding protein [Bacillota bacterium]|nr:rod-binding protein [Bacillota bacterium]
MKINAIAPGQEYLENQLIDQSNKKLGDSFQKQLNTAMDEKNQKKLYTTCQELESVFLNKAIEAMRATIPQGGLFEKSFATETFESMLFEEYSKEVSQTGSLGIADILYKQLSQQITSKG